jgi:hypothetical protein
MQQCIAEDENKSEDKIVYWKQKVERLNIQIGQLPVSLDKAVRNQAKVRKHADSKSSLERRRYNQMQKDSESFDRS